MTYFCGGNLTRFGAHFGGKRQYLVVGKAVWHKKGAKGGKRAEKGQKRAVFIKKRAKTREKYAFKRLTKFSGFNIIVKRVRKKTCLWAEA